MIQSEEILTKELNEFLKQPAEFEEWANDYIKRAQPVRDEINNVLDAVWREKPAHPALNHTEVLFRLRRKRKQLASRFCLVIHASVIDEELVAELADPADPNITDILKNMTAPDLAWKVATLSSLILERNGIFCVTLSGRNTPNYRGFIDFDFSNADEGEWFIAFTCMAEMAEAIILYGGFGPYLQHELSWLKLVGLSPRVLVHTNYKINGLVCKKVWNCLRLVEAVQEVSQYEPSWTWD